MSATGLDVLDKTIQTTNIWLDEIMAVLGPDRRFAWKVLSIVLRKLRDRLPVELSAHLSAELPLLVRGTYYDQFRPAKQPTDCNLEQFVAEVADGLSDARPVNAREAIDVVFTILSSHIPRGQIAKVQSALPKDLRAFWIAAEEAVVPPPDPGEIQRG
ncbi:MAG: hypothetical protein JWM91_3382 [Rhodospirillales bacterium]|nr:hypothetical protein [Rhodospirillales bacterium]